jgi:hypothetical protein
VHADDGKAKKIYLLKEEFHHHKSIFSSYKNYSRSS